MTTPSDDPLRILLVDDHAQVRSALSRILGSAGYQVTAEEDVPAACARLRSGQGGFDVVLTDLSLPSGTGLEVMAAAHGFDPNLPVVFVTGAGDVETAQLALEHGALRYLIKPVGSARLLAAIEEACRARAATSGARPARLHEGTRKAKVADGDLKRVVMSRHLDSALDKLWMAMQPVASMTSRRVVAHEALVRSDEPALARPDLLIAAAEDLGRLHDLGRRIRAIVASRVDEAPAEVDLLVNLHPTDLNDDDLYDPQAPLSRCAHRIILEITERAPLDDVADIHDKIARLRVLGYRIAVDDLGAGYGSLSAIALLRPDLVKIDMSLVRNVGDDPVRTRMIRSIGAMCEQLGIPWLCEGVETVDELRALVSVGADLVQGYLLAKPSRTLVEVADKVYQASPRMARATQTVQKSSLAPVALQLCRDAVGLAAAMPEAPSQELRGVLSTLQELLTMIAE